MTIQWNRVVLSFQGTPLSAISVEVDRPLTAGECAGLTNIFLEWLTKTAEIGAIVVGHDEGHDRALDAVDRAIGAVIAAARRIERGCSCTYEYHCCRCERIVELAAAIEALDKARSP